MSGPMRGGGFGRGPMRGGMMGGGLTMPVAKPRNFRGTFARLLRELRPERTKIALVVAVAFASTAGSIFGPKILGNGINKLMDGLVGKDLVGFLPAGTTHAAAVAALNAQHNPLAALVAGTNAVPGIGVDFGALGMLLLGLAALYLATSLCAFVAWYTMAGVAQHTVYRMRREVDQKLARLPLRYFDTHPHGDTLSRVTNDIDNIASALQQSLTQIITSFATIIGVLAMMFWINPLLAFISLLVLPSAALATALIARRSQRQFAAQWEQTGILTGRVEESHTGHVVVKVFGHQHEEIERFRADNQRVYEASFRAQFISGLIMPVMTLLGNLNYVAIAVLGGMSVANGTMSLGDVQAFIQYSRSFTQPIAQIASIANLLQSTLASAERVFELLDEPEETPDPVGAPAPEAVSGHVVLSGVDFRYNSEIPLISGLSADVRPGEVLAIVGPTGAGKTTLVNLLMRFYDIDAGRIEIDGQDTRAIGRDDLRRRFGMVLQDTWLFGGTIRENIAYGREGASEDEIEAAARDAHVDHFVRTLPDGYDTVIDDDASNLSAGEKQLLTIARAFLADPQILILDEATSSVDTRTEVLVQAAMNRLMKGRTVFVIAHRLSTIRSADEILVMDHGAIIEQGSHDALIAARGFYYDLYNSQFEAAITEAP
jgi:ATP-binding cassette subfamily B protein